MGVYIDKDADEEQVNEVNDFLNYLKSVCIKENGMHEDKYVMRYSVSNDGSGIFIRVLGTANRER